jgi:hypothetical protein
MNFKRFLLETEEEEKNVKAMLKKLPPKHASLLHGFHFHYVPGNTLGGDSEHIGVIDQDKITVAAPWNYGREFTTLHEIAHMVWEKLLTPQIKKAWSKVVPKNPKRQKQNDEELFCMAYANHFAKHKIEVHNHPAWDAFIKKCCEI